MPKQLQTALEARRWMVANPGCRLKDVYLGRWQWEESSAQFINWAKGADYPSDDHAPFTILDEPEVKTDPQDGTLYRPDWAGGNQPEWVRVYVADDNPVKPKVGEPFIGEMEYVWSNKPEKCLKHIYQHAQQVQITWPEWSAADTPQTVVRKSPQQKQVLKELLFALQIGAVVEYLPKEGK